MPGLDEEDIREVRKALKLPDSGVVLLMRQMEPQGYFYATKTPEEVTEEAIRDFILNYQNMIKVELGT